MFVFSDKEQNGFIDFTGFILLVQQLNDGKKNLHYNIGLFNVAQIINFLFTRQIISGPSV